MLAEIIDPELFSHQRFANCRAGRETIGEIRIGVLAAEQEPAAQIR